MIKHHRNKNDYCYANNNFWVRNFTKKFVQEVDINNLVSEADAQIFIENEIKNKEKSLQNINTESFEHKKIIITSKFDESFNELKEDVAIIGINDVLHDWNVNKKMSYYNVNNPYENCLGFLSNYYPKCVASTRTYYKFVEKYKNLVYEYTPVGGNIKSTGYSIDDYRNVVCAAIGLAYRFKVNKLFLFNCEEVFKEFRPSSEKTEDGFYIYPQQKIAHNLIDANLYWLKSIGIKIGVSGLKYKNATYISTSNLGIFFNE